MSRLVKIAYKNEEQTVAVFEGLSTEELTGLLKTVFAIEGTILGIKTEDNVLIPISLVGKEPNKVPLTLCKLIVSDPPGSTAPGTHTRNTIPSDLAIEDSNMVPERLPPFRLCIYVLCRQLSEGNFKIIGSACAVKSASGNILLTAGHCVKVVGARYFCAPRVIHPYDLWKIPHGAFDVDVVARSAEAPDFAILRRADGLKFDDNCPSLMPVADLPWNRDPAGWSGKAYVFHVPVEVIDHAANAEAGSPDVCGEVEDVTLHMYTQHHVRMRCFQRGSSGGAVISRGGRLIGVLVKSQLYGELTMEDVHLHDSRDPDAVRAMLAEPKRPRASPCSAENMGATAAAGDGKDASLDEDILSSEDKQRGGTADIWSFTHHFSHQHQSAGERLDSGDTCGSNSSSLRFTCAGYAV